jgi:Ras-related protein Rab-8A
VGKSCLLLRFADDSYTETYLTTIGLDFRIKTVKIDGREVKLQAWDTAGQERFRANTTAFFRFAQGVLIVYDITNRSSFESIRNWIDQLRQQGEADVPIVLVANKIELRDFDEAQLHGGRMEHGILHFEQDLSDGTWGFAPVVSTEEVQELADQYGISFCECSAKRNIQVDAPFLELGKLILELRAIRGHRRAPSSSKDDIIHLSNSAINNNNGRCCSMLDEPGQRYRMQQQLIRRHEDMLQRKQALH